MSRFAWFFVPVLVSATAFAESPGPFDWPQWQGPDRNAVSAEPGLLQQWPEDGPPLAWRIGDLGAATVRRRSPRDKSSG